MKAILLVDHSADIGLSQLAGPFLPYAFHRHYVRPQRVYDPGSVPDHYYRPPTSTDLGPFSQCNTWQEAVAQLRFRTSRRSLGKHGARGIYVIVPSSFPDSGNAWELVQWCKESEDSPYNQDL